MAWCGFVAMVFTGKATLSLSLSRDAVLNGGPVYGHCALAHGAIKARIEWRAERPSAISQGMKH